MNIKIFYNKKTDEFTQDLSLEERLNRYINEKFYPAYVISKLSPIYLVGGAIRDLIFARKPKDLDFVVLGNENLNSVLEVFKEFNIKYEFNRFGGYKFNYKNTKIDLWIADDLFSSIQYNVDGLFFDLRKNSLLSLTFDDFIKNGIRLVNEKNNIEKGREQKLIKFAEEYKNN